jgi:dolichol-phosphate hexosyltransferase
MRYDFVGASARALVTVVIPAKNEAPTIGDIIARCRPYADEILVVDGHSTDATRRCAEEAGVRVIADGQRGKGDAIRSALPFLRTPITVFIDADGSHDPDDIPRLIAPIVEDRADHVSASRLRGGSSELHGGFDEFFRLAGSAFITACINWRFNVRLSESQNGFRAIRTAVLLDLDLRENLTTIEQEMIIKTLRRKHRMDEVPSHEHRRRHGQSHIRLSRVAPRYLYALVRYLLF